ncbi:MAG: acyltransferase [Nanoarchaeota archaeon]
MRRLTFFPTEKNSLQYWTSFKSPLIVARNFIIIEFCKYVPSMAAKRALLRLTGMKIGRDTSIALGVQFDIFFPEDIEIGGNAIIGYRATILAHEFLVNGLKRGPVKIGSNVLIGANSTVLAGVRIGNGAAVSAMSLVNTDVKTGDFVGGVPAKRITPSKHIGKVK